MMPAPAFSPLSIGYSDGTGPEYITAPHVEPGLPSLDRKPIAALRCWGCGCCKDTPATFADLKPEERAYARLFVAAPVMHATLKALVKPYEEIDGAFLAEIAEEKIASIKLFSGGKYLLDAHIANAVIAARAALAQAEGV